MGFAVRDQMQQDVDEEIDIDGEDDAVYGAPQFTEGDVVNPLALPNEDEDVDIDGDMGTSGSSSHTLVAELSGEHEDTPQIEASFTGLNNLKQAVDDISWKGELDVLTTAVERANKLGDPHALIEALQNKMKLLVSQCQLDAFVLN